MDAAGSEEQVALGLPPKFLAGLVPHQQQQPLVQVEQQGTTPATLVESLGICSGIAQSSSSLPTWALAELLLGMW